MTINEIKCSTGADVKWQDVNFMARCDHDLARSHKTVIFKIKIRSLK